MRRAFKDRYAKNKQMLSEEDIAKLHKMRVCVIGCGGLGGYIIEMLGRIGVGQMTVIDGDVFDVTNLNRQLLSLENTIGMSKAKAAAQRMKHVNSEVSVTPHHLFVRENNVELLIESHDIVVDALDNIESRRCIAKACETLGIPFVHGAIAGWYGQVSTILPGDKTLDKLYHTSSGRGDEAVLGNPSFTPALVAAIQVSETIKVLLGKGDLLQNKVMHIDLLDNEINVFDL